MSKRFKFFFSHLSISLIILIIITMLVFFVWYPSPLFKAMGVIQLFFILVFVDVVLGPLLGLMVYKEGKETLKSDLFVVILIQICALSYGIYTIAQGRPAWIVYDGLNFIVVKNNDIENKDIQNTDPRFQHPSFFRPQFVATQTSSITSQKQFLDYTQKQQVSVITRYPIFYVELVDVKARLQAGAMPLFVLDQFNDKNRVAMILHEYPKADAWVALSAPIQDMVVLINKEKGEVVKIVDLRPWK